VKPLAGRVPLSPSPPPVRVRLCYSSPCRSTTIFLGQLSSIPLCFPSEMMKKHGFLRQKSGTLDLPFHRSARIDIALTLPQVGWMNDYPPPVPFSLLLWSSTQIARRSPSLHYTPFLYPLEAPLKIVSPLVHLTGTILTPPPHQGARSRLQFDESELVFRLFPYPPPPFNVRMIFAISSFPFSCSFFFSSAGRLFCQGGAFSAVQKNPLSALNQPSVTPLLSFLFFPISFFLPPSVFLE